MSNCIETHFYTMYYYWCNDIPCRLVAALEDEVNSLQRKIDYLESENSSLVAQVSILEETVAKYEHERKEFAKRWADRHVW